MIRPIACSASKRCGSTSASLIFYLMGALAALWLRAKGRLAGSAGFVLITLAGLAYCLWAFYGAGIEASLWTLAMTAVAIPVYWIMRWVNRSSPAAAVRPAGSPESAA